jgi:thioredoxin reductase (NADPH)
VVELGLSSRPFGVLDSSGARVRSRALIVATGARVRPWPFGFENFGVSSDAVSDGALPRMRNRPVAVIGGGDHAVTTALYLTRFAGTVYLIHWRPHFTATRMLLQQVTQHPKVRLLVDRVLVGVEGDETNGVTGLRLHVNGANVDERLAVSGIFPLRGMVPSTDFLGGQLALDPAGYVRLTAPPTAATSVPGVFAAGEVADPLYRQVVTAAASGCRAALDAQRWLERTHGVAPG